MLGRKAKWDGATVLYDEFVLGFSRHSLGTKTVSTVKVNIARFLIGRDSFLATGSPRKPFLSIFRWGAPCFQTHKWYTLKIKKQLFPTASERKTGLGPATSTLARLRSTNWAISAFTYLSTRSPVLPIPGCRNRFFPVPCFRWCKCTTKIWFSKFFPEKYSIL